MKIRYLQELNLECGSDELNQWNKTRRKNQAKLLGAREKLLPHARSIRR